MKALRTFALLCQPGLLLLLAGMLHLLRTGQVDPRDWVSALPILLLATWAVAACRGMFCALWAGAGALAGVLLFTCLAAGAAPQPSSAVWLLAAALAAIVSGLLLYRRRWLVALACAAMLLAFWFMVRTEIVPRANPRPNLTVITGLPLFWREGASGLEARADAPIVTVLRQRFSVIPLDTPLSPHMAKASRLLLAQPRLLSGHELVALDKWVQAGGRAVVFADPLLRWPSALPLGDRRRPPPVSLLSPLLEHWGVCLLPPGSAGEQRQFTSRGLLTTYAASGFQPISSQCRAEANRLIAHCAVGKGTVTLVADADLLNDHLWLAQPGAPLDQRHFTADMPTFLIAVLHGEQANRSKRWLRSEEDLVLALRWSILAGIFWAALGIALWSCRPSLPHSGSDQQCPAPTEENNI